MRKWTRWQDWAALVIGAYAILSPIWTPTTAMATTSLVVFGVLLAASALWSLAAPGAVALEWIHAALGVLVFVSPWALMYFGETAAMSWTAWIAGVLAVAAGLWAVPASNKARHEKAIPQG